MYIHFFWLYWTKIWMLFPVLILVRLETPSTQQQSATLRHLLTGCNKQTQTCNYILAAHPSSCDQPLLFAFVDTFSIVSPSHPWTYTWIRHPTHPHM